MKSLITHLLVFLFALSFNVYPQTKPEIIELYKETAKKIIDSALVNREAYSLLEELCSIGPRLSGSENSLKAIHWAESKMKSLGFDKVWLQPVMVPNWVRGNTEEAVIVSGKYKGQ